MKCMWITFTLFFLNFLPIDSIQTRIHRPIRLIDDRAFPPRHFRQIDSLVNAVPLDWEHGLREATLQALVREHVGDGNLRKHIYSAPLLGKQDKATPFGDIAILARGQLYANYAGFIFVQDPHHNDCDDCHNIDTDDNAKRRCITNHCQIWHPKSNEKLIGLWTIKRIRHRSRQDSPKYEVEFTISPIGLRYHNEGYLTKEGTFNYNLPGHVFILKSTDIRQNLEKDHNIDHLQQGFFIAQTSDGRKYVLHSFNGVLTPETPRYYGLPPTYPVFTSTSRTNEDSEEDEKKLYQTLLEVLHRKTSPDSTRLTPLKTATTLSDKTLVQFPDGQIVPITELETPFITRTTTGYVAVQFPESNGLQTTSEMHKTWPSTEGASSNKVAPQSYGIMMPQTTPLAHRTTVANVVTQQPTTGHRATIAEPYATIKEIPYTPSNVVYTKPRPFYSSPRTEKNNQGPQISGTTTSATAGSTKSPFKMTFHFFAAEEAKKTTPETSKNPSTTIQQEQFMEFEDFLSDTMGPTEPTMSIVSESSIAEDKASTLLKNTTQHPISTTAQTSSTSSRPSSKVNVTKYIIPSSTDNLSTILTTNLPKSSTAKPVTKIIPSTALEATNTYLTTSKNPYTFKIPITVPYTVNYPTTRFQQVFTVTPPPKTTYIEYAVPDDVTKYPSVQVNSPTTAITKLTPTEQDTTLFQADIETKDPSSRESTLQSTIYTEIPTLEPQKGFIETTLGVTKITGTSHNKTTEMVYYTAEETAAPVKTANQNSEPTTVVQGTQVPLAETEPTFTILETNTRSQTNPKEIVTSIKADGTVFVKMTPISADEELFGKTKSFTKKYKTTKRPKISTTSGPSDFLLDTEFVPVYKVPLFKKTLKDYSEDDIFGATKSTTSKTPNKTSVVKQYTKSDLEQALFDTNKRKSKALNYRKSSTTEPPSNVVYSDFFEASTIPMTTVVTHATTTPIAIVPLLQNTFSLANKKKIGVVTTESVPIATTTMLDDEKQTHFKPVTSRSYLTSISYEINKRKIISDGNSKERFSKKQKNVDRMLEIKENRPSTEPGYPTFENDFAFRLVGNAKGVEYLDQVGTTGASTLASTSAKTTKKSKYTRRRSYTPKAKRPTRKKKVIKGRETSN